MKFSLLSENKQHTILILILVCVAGLIFRNTISNAFIWDDGSLIVKNRYIRSFDKIPFLFTPAYWNVFFKGSNGQYRPLRTVSFVLDRAFWGLMPWGYHLTNLLLHVLNSVLVYIFVFFVLKKTEQLKNQNNKSENLLTAFLSGLFFASHPIHTESVAWIKNRSDLLCLLFFLVCLLLYIKSLKKKQAIYYLLALFSFIFSLAAKEMAFSLPIILFIYLICFKPLKDNQKNIVSVIPFILISVGYLAFKILALDLFISNQKILNLGIYQSFLAVAKTIGYYLWILIFPIGLNAERMFNIPQSFFDKSVLMSLAAIVLCVIILIKTYKQNKVFVFFFSWIFVCLIPVSNVVFLSGRPIGEQRLYIPSVGFCILLAMGIAKLLKNRRPAAVILSCLLFCFYAYTTVSRNSDWKNSLIFWSKTVTQSPNSPRAHNNLGKSYAKVNDIEKAIACFKQAIKLDNSYEDAYYNLALIYNNQNKLQGALDMINKSINLKPDKPDAYNNQGIIYEALKKYTQAKNSYQKAIKVNPYFFKAYDNLGSLYASAGKTDEALNLLNKAIEIDPEYAKAWHNLGVVYFKVSEFEKASLCFEKALQIDKYYIKAYNNLGLLKLHQGDYKKAEKLFTKALVLDPNNIITYSNMGAVYIAMSEDQKAIFAYKSLLTIDPEYAKAYYNLAVICAKQNDLNNARQNAEKALELGFSQSKELLAQINEQAIDKIKDEPQGEK